MAITVKLNYADLSAIVGKFRNEAQDIGGLLTQTKNKVESLHNNQWVGDAADKFFDEMENHVQPAVGRLVTALNTAGDVAQKCADTIRNFDQETKSFFNNLI